MLKVAILVALFVAMYVVIGKMCKRAIRKELEL